MYQPYVMKRNVLSNHRDGWICIDQRLKCMDPSSHIIPFLRCSTIIVCILENCGTENICWINL